MHWTNVTNNLSQFSLIQNQTGTPYSAILTNTESNRSCKFTTQAIWLNSRTQTPMRNTNTPTVPLD